MSFAKNAAEFITEEDDQEKKSRRALLWGLAALGAAGAATVGIGHWLTSTPSGKNFMAGIDKSVGLRVKDPAEQPKNYLERFNSSEPWVQGSAYGAGAAAGLGSRAARSAAQGVYGKVTGDKSYQGERGLAGIRNRLESARARGTANKASDSIVKNLGVSPHMSTMQLSTAQDLLGMGPAEHSSGLDKAQAVVGSRIKDSITNLAGAGKDLVDGKPTVMHQVAELGKSNRGFFNPRKWLNSGINFSDVSRGLKLLGNDSKDEAINALKERYNRELINGRPGKVVNLDPIALRNKLEALHSDPSIPRSLGRAGVRSVVGGVAGGVGTALAPSVSDALFPKVDAYGRPLENTSP